MLHDSNKTNNKKTIHDLFLYLKNMHALKNQICILRKIQISFDVRKI